MKVFHAAADDPGKICKELNVSHMGYGVGCVELCKLERLTECPLPSTLLTSLICFSIIENDGCLLSLPCS